MAKFCQNCGTALDEGTKFCPGCGKPVPQTAPPQQPQQTEQPQQSVPPQGHYTPQSQVHIPQEFAQKNAERAQRNAEKTQKNGAHEKKKKGKGGLVAFIVILLVAAIGVVCFFGFRDGGWFRGNNSKTYDAQSMQSLLDYAKQLEEAGNSEAAAAVYELIAKGVGAELIQKAHEDIPIIKSVDEMEQIKDIFGDQRGGDGE